MKIAVMADIHSNHIALERCIAEAKYREAEEYIFLGDYLGELAYPERTLDLLQELKAEYPCTFIKGNKENYWIDHMAGKHSDWEWKTGTSGSGMLRYTFERLLPEQIQAFEEMYEFLLHFHEIYEMCTDAEKKRFMHSFIERIELFPERREDGNWIKNIRFNFSVPVIRGDEEVAKIDGISLENGSSGDIESPLESLTTDETVVLLNNKFAKAKDFVQIGIDAEDYYRIKDSEKDTDE